MAAAQMRRTRHVPARKNRLPPVRVVVAALGVAAAPGAAGTPAQEADLWAAWVRQQKAPLDHAGRVSDCRRFVAANPGDPLIPVLHGMEAWHLLSLERPEEATRVLLPYLSPGQDALRRGAGLLAKAWLTRLDRERVVAALQQYYRREVRYPASLEKIAAHPGIPESMRPPDTDRWGAAWQYRLVGFTGVPGFLDQRYELESPHFPHTSDLAAALAMPYAAQLRLAPVRVSLDSRGKSVVKFTPDSSPAEGEAVTVLSVGNEAGGLYLAFVGDHLVVVCDRLHWKVFRKPTGP